MAVITLSIDSLSVSIGEDAGLGLWLPNGYERQPQPTGEQEYALNGTPIDDGPLYESKQLWTLQAFVTIEQWRLIKLIWMRSERKRRTLQDYSIVLDDYVTPWIEDVAQTRAIAPGGTVTALTEGCSYPARFTARMFEPKDEHSKSAFYPYIIKMVLKELETVPVEVAA